MINNQPQQRFKYYTLLIVIYITIQLVCVSLFGKIVPFLFGYVPISAIIYASAFSLGDVVAEVYGYAAARQLIWLNILAQFLFAIIIQLSLLFHSPSFWHLQKDYYHVFGSVLRIATGSSVAIFVSLILNAYIISKTKMMTRGRLFFLRSIIASTLAEGLLISIAYFINMAWTYSLHVIIVSILTAWLVKFIFSAILLTPTAFLAIILKKAEGFDFYDYRTSFNPFRFVINNLEAEET